MKKTKTILLLLGLFTGVLMLGSCKTVHRLSKSTVINEDSTYHQVTVDKSVSITHSKVDTTITIKGDSLKGSLTLTGYGISTPLDTTESLGSYAGGLVMIDTTFYGKEGKSAKVIVKHDKEGVIGVNFAFVTPDKKIPVLVDVTTAKQNNITTNSVTNLQKKTTNKDSKVSRDVSWKPWIIGGSVVILLFIVFLIYIRITQPKL